MVIHSFSGIEKAYAKLNLYLDVIRKREDGYHDIIGLFQTVELYDELIITLLDRPGVIIESDVRIDGKNLIEKAYEVFSKYYDVCFGLKVVLKKRVPIGGGLGGGSADAAAILRFLAKHLAVPKNDLIQIAMQVGSDVPFLIFGGTAIVEGKGEKLTLLEPITNYSVNIFCPDLSISTRNAYLQLSENDFSKGPKPVQELYEAYKKRDFSKVKVMSYNVFEKHIAPQHEKIVKALERAWQENPIVAMMTGSGSCVFSVHEGRKASYVFLHPDE